jgi:hypothetical protein
MDKTRSVIATRLHAMLEEAYRMVLLMEQQRSTVQDRVAEVDSED